MVPDDAVIKMASLTPTHRQSTGIINSPHQSLPICQKYISNRICRFSMCFSYLANTLHHLEETRISNTKDNSITNSSYTHDLIKASLLFSQIGWVHCKAHETDPSIVSKGNNYTNTAAYQAAFLSLRTHHMSLQATLLHNLESNIPNPPST